MKFAPPKPPAAKTGRPASRAFSLHKAGHDPRAAALTALARVLANEAESQAALDQALMSGDLVPSDKALCTELLYGSLRWYPRLRWFMERFLPKPEKLPWELRLCLILTLYGMAFLRMPHHAGVHWAVEHVRHRFGPGLAKVANGALRSMQRSLPEFQDNDFYARVFASEEEALACRFAMPVWIVRLWRDSYGPERCLAFLEASQQNPLQGLRLNKTRTDWQTSRQTLLDQGGQSVEPCALTFSGSLPFCVRSMLAEGKASRQSGASYAILERFQPQTWPQPIWDCCAGRGGKTLALLEQGITVALASDTSETRLKALIADYARLRLSEPPCPRLLLVSAQNAENGFALAQRLSEADAIGEVDATPPKVAPDAAPPLPERFGSILVDAPCSGLGTMSRYPEIRLRRTPEDCSRLAATQRAVLDAAWQRLQPGGRLIYITCTVNPAENEEQIQSFINNHPDAALLEMALPDASSPLREFFFGASVGKAPERAS